MTFEIDLNIIKKDRPFYVHLKRTRYLLAVFNEDRIVAEMKIELFLGGRTGQERRIRGFGDDRVILWRKELLPNSVRFGG